MATDAGAGSGREPKRRTRASGQCDATAHQARTRGRSRPLDASGTQHAAAPVHACTPASAATPASATGFMNPAAPVALMATTWETVPEDLSGEELLSELEELQQLQARVAARELDLIEQLHAQRHRALMDKAHAEYGEDLSAGMQNFVEAECDSVVKSELRLALGLTTAEVRDRVDRVVHAPERHWPLREAMAYGEFSLRRAATLARRLAVLPQHLTFDAQTQTPSPQGHSGTITTGDASGPVAVAAAAVASPSPGPGWTVTDQDVARMARYTRALPPARITVTISAACLLGATDEPGTVDNGPRLEYLPAHVVCDLAYAAGSVWRRLVTDPVTGYMADLSTHAYQVTAHLRERVIARDRISRVPGAVTPAWRCDVDHDVDHATGGPSAESNLSAKSRHGHNHKTRGTWTTRREAGVHGAVEWTTGTGRKYVIRPWDYRDPDHPTADQMLERATTPEPDVRVVHQPEPTTTGPLTYAKSPRRLEADVRKLATPLKKQQRQIQRAIKHSGPAPF